MIDNTVIMEACARFEAQPASVHPLAGGTFTAVFGCRVAGRDCVLRILPGEQAELLSATLFWLDFLSQREAPVARPLRSPAGKLVEPLEAGEGGFVAHLLEKAPGVLAEDLPPEAWDEGLFEDIGRATGRFHTLSAQYQPSAGDPRRPTWQEENAAFLSGECHHALPPALQALNQRLSAEMLALPCGSEDFGLVHGDLHFANFFVDHERITIFDFDDSCYGWYALDAAMILFDVLVLYPGEDKAAFAQRFLRAFLRGYRSQRAFSTFWLQQMPLLLKIQELWIFALLLPDEQDWEQGSWPAKFMPGRRARLEAGQPYVNVGFNQMD